MANINNKTHHVYVLRSINPLYFGKTYVGYTIDPKRRIRQHNGEIAGGAKKTQAHRPWKMIMYISGFPDERNALQFEWCCNHPYKTRIKSAEDRLKHVQSILMKDKWTSEAIPIFINTLKISWLENFIEKNIFPISCETILCYQGTQHDDHKCSSNVSSSNCLDAPFSHLKIDT